MTTTLPKSVLQHASQFLRTNEVHATARVEKVFLDISKTFNNGRNNWADWNEGPLRPEGLYYFPLLRANTIPRNASEHTISPSERAYSLRLGTNQSEWTVFLKENTLITSSGVETIVRACRTIDDIALIYLLSTHENVSQIHILEYVLPVLPLVDRSMIIESLVVRGQLYGLTRAIAAIKALGETTALEFMSSRVYGGDVLSYLVPALQQGMDKAMIVQFLGQQVSAETIYMSILPVHGRIDISTIMYLIFLVGPYRIRTLLPVFHRYRQDFGDDDMIFQLVRLQVPDEDIVSETHKIVLTLGQELAFKILRNTPQNMKFVQVQFILKTMGIHRLRVLIDHGLRLQDVDT